MPELQFKAEAECIVLICVKEERKSPLSIAIDYPEVGGMVAYLTKEQANELKSFLNRNF